MVEFSNAVIPEDKYCAPQANNPCPPTIIENTSMPNQF
jgi:hypothetical protein